MKISTKAHYGLRAMVTLAKLSHLGQTPVSVMEISKMEGLPESYLEQLISALRRGGLLRSFRGARGGYELTRSPEEITVLQVLQASGERLQFPECVSSFNTCERVFKGGNYCSCSEFWRKMNNLLMTLASETTLQDLLESEIQ